jgi:hypothetical protein
MTCNKSNRPVADLAHWQEAKAKRQALLRRVRAQRAHAVQLARARTTNHG